MESLEGVLAIVFSLSIPIVAVLGAYIVVIKKIARETELRKAIVENHVDAESIKLLIEESEQKNHKYSMLRTGCMLLGLGLGAACDAVIGLSAKHNIYFWLIIGTGIGIGMLASFVIETKMQKNENKQQP